MLVKAGALSRCGLYGAAVGTGVWLFPTDVARLVHGSSASQSVARTSAIPQCSEATVGMLVTTLRKASDASAVAALDIAVRFAHLYFELSATLVANVLGSCFRLVLVLARDDKTLRSGAIGTTRAMNRCSA